MKVRYLIKFSKESDIKFVAHLDLLRTIQRVFRRSELPVEYSKGFNPHMNVSIAQPLSVGTYSVGEYMDIVLNEAIDEEFIKDKFNENAPSGIKVFQVVKVDENEVGKKVPQAMAMVDAAKYAIAIKYENTDNLRSELDKLVSQKEWETVKKSKSGEKLVDIKAMIKSLEFDIKDNKLIVSAIVSCGSRENLSAELLSDFIKANTTAAVENSFVDVKREELYTLRDNKLVPLSNLIS